MNPQAYNLLFKGDIIKINQVDSLNESLSQKKLLLILDKDNSELSPDLDSTLSKLIEATKIPRDQVDICATPLRFHQIDKSYNSEYVIVFGWSPAQLGMQCKVFFNKPILFSRRYYLFTEGIDALNVRESKQRLWLGIKELLQIP